MAFHRAHPRPRSSDNFPVDREPHLRRGQRLPALCRRSMLELSGGEAVRLERLAGLLEEASQDLSEGLISPTGSRLVCSSNGSSPQRTFKRQQSFSGGDSFLASKLILRGFQSRGG